MKIGSVFTVCAVSLMAGSWLACFGLALGLNGYLTYAVAIFGAVSVAILVGEKME